MKIQSANDEIMLFYRKLCWYLADLTDLHHPDGNGEWWQLIEC